MFSKVRYWRAAVGLPDSQLSTLTSAREPRAGTLLKTADGGQSWQEIRKGGSTGKRNRAFRSLCFSSADQGFVVGDGGLFWVTENGGADLSQVEQAPEGVDFTGVFVLDGQGWAVAKGGRIFYFEF